MYLSDKNSLYKKITNWTIVNFGQRGFPVNKYTALSIGKPICNIYVVEAIRDTVISVKVAMSPLFKLKLCGGM